NQEEFGGLSNMSTAMMVSIHGLIPTSTEAVYQALKFPHDINLQKKIIYERSPYKAKMFARQGAAREDWTLIRIKIMRWCIRVKLAQNYHSFGQLLRLTEQRNIVEYSNKDTFWGATKINEHELQGQNALGRLLMELRVFYMENTLEICVKVSPP